MKSEFPQIGDYVHFHFAGDDFGIIESIQDRRSVLERQDVGRVKEKQILATNVDLVFICMSLNQDFNLRKLSNFLTLTYSSDVQTFILLTKRDLCEDTQPYIEQVKTISDYDIVTVSAFEPSDIDIINDIIDEKTAVFIGSSGVGKSTIINHLIGEELQQTKTIRTKDAQGRHATVNRELIRLPRGGSVIDTPGIRIVSSYVVDERNFEDILSLSEGCMFTDCSHTSEPGCMIQKSLEDGTLEQERYDQYQKVLKRNKFNKKRELERQRLLEKKMRKGR